MRLLASFVLLLFAHVALGDVIFLKNGDRITGKVKKIWDKEIHIEPEYSDEFAVEMEHVAAIKTDDEFEIELSNGVKGDYQLDGIDDAGRLRLRSDNESLSVAIETVEEIKEIKHFDWGSNIDVNGSISRGNTESAAGSVTGAAELKIDDRRWTGNFSLAREEQSGDVIKEQDRINLSYNYLFREPWFLAATVTAERDPVVNLQGRVSASPALGYDIWDDAQRTLRLQLGFGWQQETSNEVTSTSSLIEWRFKFAHDLLRGDLEIYHDHLLYKNRNGRENTVFNSTTGLKYDITDDIYLNFSVTYDYDTKPAEGSLPRDVGVLIGAGMEF